jgi:hypothetical protein
MTSSSASSLYNPNRRLTVGGGMRHACHASSIARRSVPGSRSGRKACERLRRRAPERLAIVVARFLAKTYDRRKGRHDAMFVRFRQTPYGLQVSLIQTRREGGKVRHEHIAGLGAITIPASAADRIVFWRRLHGRLSALSNQIADEQAKILGAVHERIPMLTPDEQRDMQMQNATSSDFVPLGAIRAPPSPSEGV